jgi:glutamyl/glutaminyl-tRNA synthetase
MAARAASLSPHDFAVVGSGIVGATLACLLADAGALKGLSGHRHRARWEVSGVEKPLPLFETARATTEAAVRVLCEAKGVNLGRVAQPIRVAVCGITVSPPIFDCLAFIGKASVLARMDRCIALCG